MSTQASSTVVKAFRVLALFREKPELGATECAQLLGIPKASAHRMLVSLREAGMVESTTTGGYQLALPLFELGSLVPMRRHYRIRSQVALKHLSRLLRLPAYVAVREDTHVVFVKKVSFSPGNSYGDSGQRASLHDSAPGKVLLAFGPEELVETVMADDRGRTSPMPISTASRLRDELAAVRASGYATDFDEGSLGIAAVAVPVHDGTGSVAAALAVSGSPSEVCGRVGQLVTPLQRTAQLVESRLARQPGDPAGRVAGRGVQTVTVAG